MKIALILMAVLPAIAFAGSPYRYENITDEEVREIQGVVSGISSWPITMISGVSAKCRCEEGPACSSQVSVTLQEPGDSQSLELSKVDGHWIIGRWQKWLLRHQALSRTYFKRAENGGFPVGPTDYTAYLKAENALRLEMPVCPESAPATMISSGRVSRKKIYGSP